MSNGRNPEKHFHGLKQRVATMAGILLLVAAIPSGPAASLLEGPHILYRTSMAMGRFTSLEIKQRLTLYPESPEAEPRTFEEIAIYVMPERFRSDIESDEFQQTHLEFGDTFLTVLDGQAVVEENRFNCYQRLLRYRTQSQLLRTVNQLGVETAISSLGRVGDTIVFVLGARYPDESVSQLAIDKETFLPHRLLLVDVEHDDPPIEILYRDWRKVEKGWFPYHIVSTVGNQLSREIRVTELRPNPRIPKEKMDLEALKNSIVQHNHQIGQQQEADDTMAGEQKTEDLQKAD